MEIKPGSWMPIPTDQTILTNEEMTDLRAIGITELKGMKLPADLAEKIHAARVDATNRKMQLQPGATFDPSQVVNIEDLPETHKRALKNYIIQSQPMLRAEADVQQQVNVIIPNNPGIMPNLTKAMEVAAAASVVSSAPPPPPAVNRPGVVVMTPPPVTRVHNPPPPAPPSNPPKVVVPVPASWSNNMNTPAPVPATPVVQSPPPAAPIPMPTMEEQPYFINPPAATSIAAAPASVTLDDFKNTTEPVEDRCPRCAFDRKKNKLVEEPTHNDLIEYRAQSVIGGHRYYKEYLTFGGQLRITFRTLTQREEDCAVIQVVRDGQDNLNNKDILADDYLRSQKRYRMIMSIEKIVRGDNLLQLATYDSYDKEKTVPDKDRLRTFYDQVLENALTSSSLFNVVQEKFDNFDSYIAVMELRADDPKSYPTTQQP